jgi:hypothetical protein
MNRVSEAFWDNATGFRICGKQRRKALVKGHGFQLEE